MNPQQKKIAEIIKGRIEVATIEGHWRVVEQLKGTAVDLADIYKEEDKKYLKSRETIGFPVSEEHQFNPKQFLKTAGVEE